MSTLRLLRRPLPSRPPSSPIYTRSLSTRNNKSRGHGLAALAATAGGLTAATAVVVVGRSRSLRTNAVLCEEEKKGKDSSLLPSLPTFTLPDLSLPSMTLPTSLQTWLSSLSTLSTSLTAFQLELTGGPGSVYQTIISRSASSSYHPEIQWDATVRLGTDVGLAERAFMRERRSRIVPAFAKLMGVEESQVDERDLPVIALAGSGGGYRAMVSCMGAVGAAEEMGLWDTVSFVSGVSGSCWALSTLYSVGEGEIEKTLRHVKGAVGTPFLDPSSLERLVKGPTHEYLMEGAVLKSASETGELSLVDAYGTLVSARLFVPSDLNKLDRKHLKVSHQRRLVDDGSHPLPIYCAIRHDLPNIPELEVQEKLLSSSSTSISDRKKAKESKAELVKQGKWNWFEVSPYEMGSDDMAAWIPTWALGRTFENGKSVERVPELSLTILSGVFASAFCATLFSYYKEVKPLFASLPFADTITSFISRNELAMDSTHIFPPAELPNPMRGMDVKDLGKNAPKNITELETLGFLDAGANLNIPYLPLFRRDCDIIIALDASADSQDLWFDRAATYASARGLARWPRVDFSALFPSANPETSSSSDDAATKAAAKVDAAKAQEKEMVDAQGGKEHLTLGGNPSKVPEGSAPRSSKVEKEEEGGEPKLGKCNIWVGSTDENDHGATCRMDHPTVEQVISRDGISLVYFPLSTGEGGKAQEVVDNWSTWRFEYTEKEVDEMVELSKGNFLSGREEVKILVRGVWERKKRQRKERERKEREGVDGE